jgi:hypothetical protein
MRNSIVLGAVCSVVLSASSVAEAGTVFVSSLSGSNVRPPVDSDATGSGTATLTGSAGKYVLRYTINYEGLTSDPTEGFIHYSVIPPNKRPTDQNGPIVDRLDNFPDGAGRSGTITGDWRWDEVSRPLTDELVDSLFDGELYFNIDTEKFPGGEIRGQIVDPSAATPIPLPPAVWTGLMGLGAAGMTVMRFGRMRRA